MTHRPYQRPLLAWLPVAAIVLAAGCTKHDLLTSPPSGAGADTTLPALQTKTIPAPALSSLKSSSPTIATCGTATVYSLTEGKRIPGTVTVSNDANNIYINYATPKEHWWISDTRLAVVKTAAEVPKDDAGQPAPWDFPLAGTHEPPITSVTYTVSLSKLGAQQGSTVYIAAMAGVVHPVNENNYDGDWEWMVMWGVGNTDATAKEVIHPYTIASCGGTTTPPPPPPVTTPPPTTSGGIITITFDDGWLDTYKNSYPVLKALNLKADAAVNPRPINEGWGDYMRPAQVQELWDNGWAVVSHTMDHEDLTRLSASAMEAEIRDSKAWIVAHHYGPAEMFVVPFHSWGPRERAMVQKYHKYARGHTIDEWSPEHYTSWPITEPLDIYAFEPEYAPFKTASGRALTMAKIKYAVDNGKYLDLMFHHVPTSTLPQFKDLMTQIAGSYRANIRTYRDIIQ